MSWKNFFHKKKLEEEQQQATEQAFLLRFLLITYRQTKSLTNIAFKKLQKI